MTNTYISDRLTAVASGTTTAPMRLLACLAVAGLGACFDAEVGEAAITCADDADCPAPLFCGGSVCRRGSADDIVAPGVVADSVGIAPAAVRPGERAVLTFTVTEALGAPPEVAAPQVEVGAAEGDALAFTVPLIALATEGSHELVVDLVDVAGNESDGVRLGVLRVDGTAPAARQVTAPDTIGVGVSLVVVIDASEPLGAASCVYTVQPGGRAQTVTADVDGARATCAAVHEGNIGSGIVVDATLEDEVGNATIDTAVASVGVIF